ncbi:MAG: ATP-binding cassette domain-containing protein [Oscillospiraceae bacterium]|jgi:ABC-2 type transport system ATP-binding protein
MEIRVKNLVKRYGELVALDHFNLEISEGEVFGLLGPNGSGKTTAINCILSLLKYDKGTIEVMNRPMSPTAYDIKREIGVVMQNVAVFDELTVRENIDYFCGLYIRDKKERERLVDEAVEFVGLKDYVKLRPKKLSGGLLRRLNIACGIAHKPKLIIMDEPTVAVDPQSRNNILEGILELNRQGATVLYTSHYMEEVERICTRIAIMDKGRIITSGTAGELKSLISTGEKVTIEACGVNDRDIEFFKNMPGVISVDYSDCVLRIKSKKGRNNLAPALEYLKSENIEFSRIYSELPTLNDVFLEITGKELRN